ncbi:MAG: hypothetical protein HY748_16760 [Elusimicrobia bacterium]|nr:hypothetical protein [Elusimicrobiota bacterium]
MTPEAEAFQKELEARTPEFEAKHQEMLRREVIDRKNYVRPAPSGFKPKRVGRKIKMTLFLENKVFRVLREDEHWLNRGPLRYRVEIQNVGRETIFWIENHSFIKTGYLGGKFAFYAITPKGRQVELEWRLRNPLVSDVGSEPIPIPGFDRLPEAEKGKAAKAYVDELNAQLKLALDLHPGETLVSRHFLKPEPFMPFLTDYEFTPPGVYGIKVVFNDPPPKPPDEDEIQHWIKRGFSREEQLKEHQRSVVESFGRVESNIVKIQVVP